MVLRSSNIVQTRKMFNLRALLYKKVCLFLDVLSFWPDFGNFQLVLKPMDSSFWKLDDSGRPLKAYALPSAALRVVGETMKADAQKKLTLAERVAKQIELEKKEKSKNHRIEWLVAQTSSTRKQSIIPDSHFPPFFFVLHNTRFAT